MGVPISQWCPNGSVMRPSRQPCSSPTGEVTVAPAAKAALTMLSGSPVTSRVRLVPPSIAAALNRPFSGSALATQKQASPTANCATVSSPSPTW
jgi:hypothetical protein